jgi:hypothetical protein
MSWKKVWFILFLAALVTWFWPLDKSAQAIDLQRFEATGQIHVLGVNEFTSTPGFFDRDEKPVLKIGSVPGIPSSSRQGPTTWGRWFRG